MPKWLKSNGKPIMDSSGRPFECPTCPCTTPVPVECAEAVDAEIQSYLDIIDPDTQQHVWTLYGTYEAAYTCAEWAYDDSDSDGVMEWRLVHPASGYLLIALRRGQIVTDTTNCHEEKLVYAKTIYKIATGEYKTIGCQCHVSDHECKHSKVVRDDYLIAGELHVKPYDESDSGESYAPSDACEVDTCELLKLKMETAHYWHGGQLMGEGYYDWLTAPHVWTPENLRYQPFLMAIKWEVETSESESTSTSESVTPVYNVTYLNCGCTNILTHTLQEEETCLEYAGICTLEDPCIDMMLLHNECEVKGWIWHGEGVLAHLNKVTTYGGTTVYGDWYELLEQSWQGQGRTCSGESISFDIYMACAETPTSYKLVGCDCYVYSEEKIKDQPTTGYWKYFDLDGVCGCSDSIKDGNNPIRELLLTYPEEFGIIEFQYGNNSLYVYDNGSGEKCYCCADTYEPVQGTSGQTMYIDYRALCWIGRVLYSDGTEKRMIRVCYPDGSKGVPDPIDYVTHYCTPPTHNPKDVSWWICDTAEFKYGYWQPFTYCPYLTWSDEGWKQFSGHHYGWGAGQVKWSDQNAFHDGQIGGCQPTETCGYTSLERAQEAAGCGNDTPTPCISVDTTTAHLWQYMPVLAPDFTVSDHPCSIREIVHEVHEDMGDGESWDWTWSEWCVIPRWTTFGVNIGTTTESWGDVCYWSILNVNYVETNKGLLVKGLDGYVDSYVLIGASHYPEYTWCWSDECKNPRTDPWSGEIYDPCHWLDETIDCPADEDMHSCLGFEDWQFPDESDSSSSSDTSDSSSIGE